MHVWNPREKQAIRFVRILMDSEKSPVLVHCQHGADRTGALCALYRIAVEGWAKEEALKEMIDGGFGFHPIWTYLIEHWVNGLSIEKIRREAGVQRRQNVSAFGSPVRSGAGESPAQIKAPSQGIWPLKTRSRASLVGYGELNPNSTGI
jgi:hypothetical protein